MKNNNGFTLVELLAVIAILAILVIIALPNVMGMFNDAKESSFKTELKNIYKVAQQQWISDSMFSTGDKEYIRKSDGSCSKELDLTGRKELNYYIKIDKSGNVVKYYASDGTYQYVYNGSGLDVTDIQTVSQIADLTEDNIIEITCDGADGNVNLYGYITEEVNYYDDGSGYDRLVLNYMNQYDDYESAIKSSNHNLFLKFTVNNEPLINKTIWCIKKWGGNSCNPGHLVYYENEESCLAADSRSGYGCMKIKSNISGHILDKEVGFVKDGKTYFLNASSSKFESNKSTLLEAFGEENCEVFPGYVRCTNEDKTISADAGDRGDVDVHDKELDCFAHETEHRGKSMCEAEGDNEFHIDHPNYNGE